MADQSSPISWTTTKQKLTATSTCNAEYVALSAAVDETLYLQQLLSDIDMKNINFVPANLFSKLDPNIKLPDKTEIDKNAKHIFVRYYHIRDHLGTDIVLKHIPGNSNLADTFTKPLSRDLFKRYSDMLRGFERV